MKIYQEIALKDFEFWSGGRCVASYLTEEEFDTIEAAIIDSGFDCLSETQLNDIFWFDGDFIALCLGFENEEEMWLDFERRQKNG